MRRPELNAIDMQLKLFKAEVVINSNFMLVYCVIEFRMGTRLSAGILSERLHASVHINTWNCILGEWFRSIVH